MQFPLYPTNVTHEKMIQESAGLRKIMKNSEFMIPCRIPICSANHVTYQIIYIFN